MSREDGKHFLAAAALLMTLAASVSFGSWVGLSVPAGARWIDAMDFATPDTGLLIDGDHVWRTYDGCLSYVDVTPPGLTLGGIVQCLNCANYYVLGNYTHGSGALWHTTDGGSNWQMLFEQGPARECAGYIRFLDQRNGFIGFAKDGPEAHDTMFRTTDGGGSWDSIPLPNSHRFTSILFLDSLLAYATTPCTLWHTTDGGSRWQEEASFDPTDDGWLDGAWFATPERGYSALHRLPRVNAADVSVLYSTNDAGRTWQEALRVTSYYAEISSVDFDGLGSVYVLGSTMTMNGDVHWPLYKSVDGRHFFRVAVPWRGTDDVAVLQTVSGSQTVYAAVDTVAGDTSALCMFKSVDGGGESLGFWNPVTQLPWKPKKGVLLTFGQDSSEILALEKGTGNLWGYQLGTNTWRQHKPLPGTLKDGSVAYYEQGMAVARTKSHEFWCYDANGDSWFRLPDIPGETLMRAGGCITSDGPDPIYLLKGQKTREFWIYDAPSQHWQRGPDFPGTMPGKNECMACDGEYVYAWPGNKTSELWVFDIAGDSWLRGPDIPGGQPKPGTCMAANPYGMVGYAALLKGGTHECWTYDLGGFWKLEPGVPSRKKLSKGAQIVADDANVYYALAGSKCTDLWHTDNLTLAMPDAFHSRPSKPVSAQQPASSTCGSTQGVLSSASGPLIVHDITGRRVARIANPAMLGSEATIGGPLARSLGLRPGVYIITSAGTSRTRKLVVAR